MCGAGFSVTLRIYAAILTVGPPGHINWFTNTSEASTSNDSGLLVKNPHFVTSPGHIELPLITTMPAFKKLHNQPLTSEMSLQILYDAKQQIAEAMSFFRSKKKHKQSV